MSKTVTLRLKENVYKICDKPQPIIIRKLLLTCKKRDLVNSLKIINILKTDGYSYSDILICMKENLKVSKLLDFDEETKIEYLQIIGNTYLNIMKGVDTLIQLTGCIAELCKLQKTL